MHALVGSQGNKDELEVKRQRTASEQPTAGRDMCISNSTVPTPAGTWHPESAPESEEAPMLCPPAAEKIAALEAELQDSKEELAIQQSKFDLEVRHAQHVKRKCDSAWAEVARLSALLSTAQGQAA